MNAERMKRESMERALNAPPQAPTIQVTPEQMAVLLVFEGQVAQLQIAANQLGGWLGLKAAADVIVSAREHIEAAKVRMQAEWSRAIVVPQPAEVARIVAP